jgi:hypothetical protein
MALWQRRGGDDNGWSANANAVLGRKQSGERDMHLTRGSSATVSVMTN